MLDGAPSIDSVFLPLKDLAKRGNNPLRLPLRSFLGKLNELLTGRKNIPEGTVAMRDEHFSLRIKAISWLLKEEVDITARLKELDKDLSRRENDEHVGVLVSNMRFALRAHAEVFEAVTHAGMDFSKIDSAPLTQLEDIAFSQFESVLLVGVPNQQAAQLLLGWMHASMDMEVGLLMGDSVLQEEVRISPARLNQLNGFLVNASQTYAGSARVLGLVPTSKQELTLAAEPLPTGWVKGQKRLADQGLGDWLRL